LDELGRRALAKNRGGFDVALSTSKPITYMPPRFIAAFYRTKFVFYGMYPYLHLLEINMC